MTVDFTYVLHKRPAYDYSKAYDLSSKLQPYAHTILVICHTIRNTYAHTMLVICHTILHVKRIIIVRSVPNMVCHTIRCDLIVRFYKNGVTRTILKWHTKNRMHVHFCLHPPASTSHISMAYEKSYARPSLSACPPKIGLTAHHLAEPCPALRGLC